MFIGRMGPKSPDLVPFCSRTVGDLHGFGVESEASRLFRERSARGIRLVRLVFCCLACPSLPVHLARWAMLCLGEKLHRAGYH